MAANSPWSPLAAVIAPVIASECCQPVGCLPSGEGVEVGGRGEVQVDRHAKAETPPDHCGGFERCIGDKTRDQPRH